MLVCPVCGRSGFTAISIRTHVEVCLQQSERNPSEDNNKKNRTTKKKKTSTAGDAGKFTEASDPIDLTGSSTTSSRKNDANSFLEYSSRAASPSLSQHVHKRKKKESALSLPKKANSVETVPRKDISRSDEGVHKEVVSVSSMLPEEESIYNSISIEDLDKEVFKKSVLWRSRKTVLQQHTVQSYKIRILMQKFHNENKVSRMGQQPCQSDYQNECTDRIMLKVAPDLLRSFAECGVHVPPPQSIPDIFFSHDKERLSSEVNSLYLKFWEADSTAVNAVYQSLLDHIVSVDLDKNALDPSSYFSSTNRKEIGYCEWTVDDVASMLSATEAEKKMPDTTRSVQNPHEAVSKPITSVGRALCVRPNGATVRDAVDIDNSSALPFKLKHNEDFFFEKLALLEPADEECVAVIRLYGYLFREQKKVYGWASLSGRTVEDHDPILRIVSTPTWLETHPLQGVVYSSNSNSQQQEETLPTQSMSVTSKQDAILSKANCPICGSLFSESLGLDARERHVNKCLQEMQDDLFSQPST